MVPGPGAGGLQLEPSGGAELPETTDPVEEVPTEQRPLTRAEVQQILAERDQQWERRFQSQMDKRESHIRKMLQERNAQAQLVADTAKKRGMTDEQAASLRAAFLEDAVAEATKEEDPPQRQRQESDEPGQEEIAQRAQQLATRYGLAQGDPELELLQVNGSLQDYFDSIVEAGLTKRARLKSRDGNRSPGVLPTGGRAPNFPDLKDASPDDLWNRAIQSRRPR